MKNKKVIVPVVILILVLLGFSASIFTVDETKQAIVIQLGRPVRTIKKPGLYFKLPFIQTVYFFENRVLEYDAAAAKIITSDKKHLVVDNFARWKIIDPLKFYTTVRNEFGAQSRLDDIIFSEIREELARHTLMEIVSVNRREIMNRVGDRSDELARAFGIRVIDVRIKRADLPAEVTHSVYARMRAERERKAKKYRSQGEEEAVKIRAEADKERTILLAEAYRKSQILRGQGDARAVRIYARAFGRAPAFYSFLRSLEVLRRAICEETTLILDSDSDLFKYLGKYR